jgi:hypothetical protein
MTEVANQRDLYLPLRAAIYRRRHLEQPVRGTAGRRVPRPIVHGALPASQQTVDEWFNPACFAVPTPFAPSNEGSNILAGPSLTTLDFGLLRKFPFGEGRRLEFRWEAFNLFDTPLFGLPSRDASSAGTIGPHHHPRRRSTSNAVRVEAVLLTGLIETVRRLRLARQLPVCSWLGHNPARHGYWLLTRSPAFVHARNLG